MLNLINEVRSSFGLDPLKLETNLNESAEDHSQWMMKENVFSHTGENGTTSTQRITSAGFDLLGSWGTAENLAVQTVRGAEGYLDDVKDLHESLMNSPGHRANILNPDLKYIGIGIELGTFSYSNGVTATSLIVTQNFGRTQGTVDLDDLNHGKGEIAETVVDAPVESPDVEVASNEADAEGGPDAPLDDRIVEPVWAGNGHNFVRGESGDDRIYGMNGFDTLWGGDGDDTISGGGWADTIRGDAGDDSLMGDNGDDLIFGGTGNDTIKGGLHADTLKGDAGDDVIDGEQGNDVLWGGDGNDSIDGGAGFDTVWSGAGNDTIRAGGWADTIGGGGGNDFLYGDNGDDLIWGGDGDDVIEGGLHNDRLNGGAGEDHIIGEQGDDAIDGGWGNDTIYGGSGKDVLSGERGDDVISGGWGNDRIFGQEGHDTLSGDEGDDFIWAGWGDDDVTGGSGADVFVFGHKDGNDIIRDFDATEGDVLRLNDSLWRDSYGALSTDEVLSTFGETQGDTFTLTFDGGETITFDGNPVLEDAIVIF
ncbi:CAP domain-containing protein [Sulfitobacter undariae]|nr:CAP domain-containing protein [Sulfitobacter undariae]